jgi:hypothetical protein
MQQPRYIDSDITTYLIPMSKLRTLFLIYKNFFIFFVTEAGVEPAITILYEGTCITTYTISAIISNI